MHFRQSHRHEKLHPARVMNHYVSPSLHTHTVHREIICDADYVTQSTDAKPLSQHVVNKTASAHRFNVKTKERFCSLWCHNKHRLKLKQRKGTAHYHILEHFVNRHSSH